MKEKLDEKTNVTKNGIVITPSKIIEKGVVVFEDRKIKAVGHKNRVKVPKSAKVIDVSSPTFSNLSHGSRKKSGIITTLNFFAGFNRSKEWSNSSKFLGERHF